MPEFLLGAGIEVIIEPPTPTEVIVVPVTGAQGPQGPAGARYEFVQGSPAATWTIVHNLNAYPDFLFFLTAAPSVPVHTDVAYPDANTTVVTWPSPESGRAES